jgi:AraC-like DNA-binding protein
MTVQISIENPPPCPAPSRIAAEIASFRDIEIEPAYRSTTLQAWKARRVTTYIAEQLGSDIRLAAVSQAAGLSPCYFSKIFLRTFGQSLRDYVQHQRVERAQSLMLETRLTLSAIALDCGFCDQAHMSRLFHTVIGSTPSRWRRQQALA